MRLGLVSREMTVLELQMLERARRSVFGLGSIPCSLDTTMQGGREDKWLGRRESALAETIPLHP